MIWHLFDKIGTDDPIILVISPHLDQNKYQFPKNVTCVIQEIPRGTGDAVRIALSTLSFSIQIIYILNGDGPAVPISHIRTYPLNSVVLAPRSSLPFSQTMGIYCLNTHTILENPQEQHPEDLVNTGVYILENTPFLHSIIKNLPFHSEKGEYFLTDILPDLRLKTFIANGAHLFQGINTLDEWLHVENLL